MHLILTEGGSVMYNETNRLLKVVHALQDERRGSSNCYCDRGIGYGPCANCRALILATNKALKELETEV